MTSPIENAIAKVNEAGSAAFIPYMTAGYPDRETFLDIAAALDEAGADVIEIGLPFSDPVADGPVIQDSSSQALEMGITPPEVLELVGKVRKRVGCELLVMTYYNPVLHMGLKDFASGLKDAGASGIIIPDLPPEESGEWKEHADLIGIDTIFMAAPTTTRERLSMIARETKGFLYYVSFTGVTGAALSASDRLLADIRRVKQASEKPVAVGFGVARPEQAEILAAEADGVIVGTALIRAVQSQSDKKAGIKAVRDLALSIKNALLRSEPAAVRA